MTHRWRTLLLAGLAAGLLVTLLARLPRRQRAAAAPAPPAPVTDLSLAYARGRLTPESASVPRGHRVALVIANLDADTVTLALAGYGDSARAGPIPPGGTWRLSFRADLPGDDFAWLPEGSGVPAGRLSVTGSHLVEGHR